ncbi:Hydroxysteroid dehydrogenase-like protein 2 [Zancudomyces culisetae]|nr:Hydroxysteroid dehydrogenase-like protein 2 [Zancudomyces culisetae]|eukprot:OMH84529.1 Hydroxysteroid dehydrogenase-like protein 2 [Zancudomyces culisetae]
MNNINTRGTWLTSKLALPYLKASSNAHILNLSPPLSMESKWFKNHTAYSIAKYGMSLCVLGMSAEFQKHKIAVNALWPLTTIATEALKMIPNPNLVSRNTDIISDSAHLILTKPSSEKCNTGNFYLDELLLRKHGVVDFEKYNAVPNTPIGKLTLDFFLDPKQVEEVMKLRAQQ